MLQKNIRSTNTLLFMQIFFVLITSAFVNAQVYQHNFGTTAITAHPYTVAPSVIDPHLSGSAWTNSTGSWTSFGGSSGQAITVVAATGTTTTITLTFDVAPNYAANLTSFNFWRQRSNTGPQNWAMTINGTNAGSGTTPNSGSGSGAEIGVTALGSAFSGLTGTVTVSLALTNSGGGNFRLDDFTLNGTVVSTCATSIASFLPATGPEGTIVTLNGTNFTGATAVKFGSISATNFSLVSDTQIQAQVPAGATSGNISVTNGCETTSASSFTLLTSSCASVGTEIYISELYDEEAGSGGAIELFNPTGSTITFNGNYVLKRYGEITDTTTTPAYTLTLTGSIGPGMTLVLAATAPSNCAVSTVPGYSSGFNGGDKFELLKNGVIIDLVHVPYTDPGYTLIRQANATAPSAAYNINDWINSDIENCSTLGSHTATSIAAPTVIQPVSQTACENGAVTFTVTLNPSTGFTYQWKVLNGAGIWVNVSDDANYSGAATNALTINTATTSFDNSQYYCEITSATCTVITNAVQLDVVPAPIAPTVTITQPTCSTPTGTITIDNPVAGLTYSINGTAGTTFTGLVADTYTVTVENSTNCTATTSAIINAVPNAPALPAVTVTNPTCTTATGTITIDNPVAGLTYSINGITGTTFTGLLPDTYTVTVQNNVGCTSVTPAIIINAAPNAPAAPTVTVTQPTCTTATGTITIDNPLAGLTYSINGTTGTTFTGLIPDTYTVTVQNTDGCTATVSTTVNIAPNAPAVPAIIIDQPTCTTATGTITIDTPVTGLTYSINGTTGTTFTGLVPDTYTVTVQNAGGCISVTSAIINAAPVAPAVPAVTVTQPTCTSATGTISVDNPVPGLTYSINGTTGTTFTGLVPDTYIVTVQSPEGCEAVTAPIVINSNSGIPAITTSEGCNGANYLLTVATNGSFDINDVTIVWSIGGIPLTETSPILNVTAYAAEHNIDPSQFPLQVDVKVTTLEGCENTAAFNVESTFCTIPKGVSPNNDTKNDSFNLIGLNVSKLSIFNRYGKNVYRRNNYTNEWVGQTDNNGDLPTGTYYYVIELLNGESKTGWVYLNREN